MSALRFERRRCGDSLGLLGLATRECQFRRSQAAIGFSFEYTIAA